MRDIRADLVERVQEASKAAASALDLYTRELRILEAKHRPIIERYENEIEFLNLLLAYERERNDRVAQNTKLQTQRALQNKPIPNLKIDTTEGLEEPIRSETDAKGRLDRLTSLVRDYIQKEEHVSNIHRLSTDTISRPSTDTLTRAKSA